MSNRERVLEFLKSVGPEGATNSEILAHTGVRPHQQVFQITQTLAAEGVIKALHSGKDWRFWIMTGPKGMPSSAARPQHHQLIVAECSPHAWDKVEKIALRLRMDWTPLGRVTIRDNNLVFPTVSAAPGIYRFRVKRQEGRALYIGETDNLARRFSHYRNPGPTQDTNIRVNARLCDELKRGADIGVATVTEGAWIERSTGEEVADLSAKPVRLLFENAAIIAGHATDIELLNR